MPTLLSKRRYELLAAVIFAVFAVIHVFTMFPVLGFQKQPGALHRFVQTLEGRVTTVFFRARGVEPAHPDIVVLEIDERGAQKYGLWPWPREVMAKALGNLIDADAKVIGLDIAFLDSSPQNLREKEWLAALEAESALPGSLVPLKEELAQRVASGPDEVLEAVLRKAGPRIVQGAIPYHATDLGAFSPEQQTAYRENARAALITSVPLASGQAIAVGQVESFIYEGMQMPLTRFAQAGSLFGHFGTEPDVDSTIRRSPLLPWLNDAGGLFPSLALQVTARQLGAIIVPQKEDGHLSGIELRGPKRVFVPVDGENFMTQINYPGGPESFARLSIVDAIDGTFKREQVAGKAFIAGVTIMGSSGDQRVTPFSDFSPGVFTHASLISNMLQQRFLSRPGYLLFLEPLLMLLLGLGIAVVTARVRRFSFKLIVLAAILLGCAITVYVAFLGGVKMSFVVPLTQLTATAFGCVFLGYLSVDREKLKMRSTFSRYLGEDVMDVALQDPDKLNQGEKREMTVLFSDIRGFTSISERMTPEKLAEFINEYLSPMTAIVFEEKGTLDKYIGDAVMAFWNAPLNQPDHALRACRAAVHMLERLEELKVGWRKAGYPELEIGVGINTGQMVVGNMGSDVRVDYTVLGDSVNLGSRLEGTNKEYDTRIIISEFTWAAAKDGIIARRLGAVRVKGKKVPVGIYELRGVGRPSDSDAQAITAFEAGLAAMVARDFDGARQHFEQVLTLWPGDAPARAYLGELDEFRDNPPPADWDGVVTMKTK